MSCDGWKDPITNKIYMFIRQLTLLAFRSHTNPKAKLANRIESVNKINHRSSLHFVIPRARVHRSTFECGKSKPLTHNRYTYDALAFLLDATEASSTCCRFCWYFHPRFFFHVQVEIPLCNFALDICGITKPVRF